MFLHFTSLQKRISCFLKLIVVISALVGTLLSAYAGRRSFMGGSRVFMYFTIQSNLAVAAVCAVGFFLILRGKPVSNAWFVLRLDYHNRNRIRSQFHRTPTKPVERFLCDPRALYL